MNQCRIDICGKGDVGQGLFRAEFDDELFKLSIVPS